MKHHAHTNKQTKKTVITTIFRGEPGLAG